MKLVVFVVLACSASLAYAESAAEMLSACKTLADVRVQGDTVQMPQDYESGLCWGAFSVIQRIIYQPTAVGRGRLYGVCAPVESKRSQLIAIFVEYMRRNPKRLHEDSFTVAREALAESFPCPK